MWCGRNPKFYQYYANLGLLLCSWQGSKVRNNFLLNMYLMLKTLQKTLQMVSLTVLGNHLYQDPCQTTQLLALVQALHVLLPAHGSNKEI